MKDLLLASLRRLLASGSGHFPVFVDLSLESRAPLRQDEPEDPDAEERERVNQTVDKVEKNEGL